MSKKGLSILPVQNASTRQPVCQTGACRREEVASDAPAVVADAVTVVSPTPSREVIIINNTIQYPTSPNHHYNYHNYGSQQYCYPSACFLNPRTYSYCSPVYYPQSLCRYSCP